MKWNIPVQVTEVGRVEVEAPTLAEAMRKVTVDTAALKDRTQVGAPMVYADIEMIRRVYNDGQADAENELMPFIVDMTDRKFYTVIIWAKDRKVAQDCAYRMINDDSPLLVVEDAMMDVDDVALAGAEEISQYKNIVCEGSVYRERTEDESVRG